MDFLTPSLDRKTRGPDLDSLFVLIVMAAISVCCKPQGSTGCDGNALEYLFHLDLQELSV